jgi:3-phosphoshikimate 1-carboxyvinyltransferase
VIVKIEKSKLSGVAEFPPSKSDSHRLIIAAALAEGESVISGISLCDDVIATIESLRALGADISLSGNVATVRGVDILNTKACSELPVNESGSTLRFLIPLALMTGNSVRFVGKERLFQRPLSVYAEIAKKYGAEFEISESALKVCGKIKSGEYRLRGDISSQFITGLLFALPLLQGDSKIIIEPPFESRPYVDMTVATLKKFGIDVQFEDENTIAVGGNQKYRRGNFSCEGDWSGGAFLFALGLLHPEIKVLGYDIESLQGDKVCIEYFEKIKGTGVGTTCGAGANAACAGATCATPIIDISDCPDLGPILFAMAAYFGEAEFIGTRRLLIKESDRAGAMAAELQKFGAVLEIYENSVKVHGGNLHAPSEVLLGHNDHRIVMSLAVLCSILGGEIRGAEAIAKSYPEFFEVFSSLGGNIEILEN